MHNPTKYVLAHLNKTNCEYWFYDGYWKKAPNPCIFNHFSDAQETLDFEVTAFIDYHNEAYYKRLGKHFYTIAAKDLFTVLVISEDNIHRHLFMILPIYN